MLVFSLDSENSSLFIPAFSKTLQSTSGSAKDNVDWFEWWKFVKVLPKPEDWSIVIIIFLQLLLNEQCQFKSGWQSRKNNKWCGWWSCLSDARRVIKCSNRRHKLFSFSPSLPNGCAVHFALLEYEYFTRPSNNWTNERREKNANHTKGFNSSNRYLKCGYTRNYSKTHTLSLFLLFNPKRRICVNIH